MQQQQQPTITFGTMRLINAITDGYRDIAWVAELVPLWEPGPAEREAVLQLVSRETE